MNDSDEDEDQYMMGTAFPELDDQQSVSKKADIDLTVRDEKGRRRFHGAFTGGFSAGYWNTVGSAEGFTPSLFVSTRKEKWDKNLLRQKPEDFMDSEDLGVFGIAPQTVHTRDEFAQHFAGLRDSNATVIDVLKSVIKPTVESIGVRLYKQMKRSARTENIVNVYGCDNTSDDNVKSSDILVKPKCDFHGIGYKGMITPTDNTHLTQASNTAGISAVLSGGRKIKISGEAFGYGALEEEENDEDDAVIYYKDDMSRYDFETGIINKKANLPNKMVITKELEYGKTNIITGFVKCSPVSSLKSIINKKYPLPVIPRDWKPSKQSIRDKKQKKSRWDQKTSQTEEQNIATEEDNDRNDAKHAVLNANVRAVILGDEIVRIQRVKPTPLLIEQTVNSESNSSVPERNVQSNKHLSGFLSNKFVRETESSADKIFGGLTEFSDKSSAVVNTVKPEEGSEIIERVTYEWHPINLLCKRFNVPNPYPQFPDVVGIVTAGKLDVRNRTSFLHNEKKIDNIFSYLNQPNNSVISKLSDDNSVFSDNKKINHKKEAINYTKTDIYEENIEDNTEESEQNEERPPMDLFKAIFASDDETDEENNSVIESSNTEKILDNTEDSAVITKASTTGLFSNIDFDQLNRNFNPIIKSDSVETEIKTDPIIDNIANVANSENDDTYGPVLPPLYSVDTTNKSIENSAKSPKRKRKHKKHKKPKKLSLERKKRKSRHRRHSSSSSNSSSDTDTDKHLLEYLKSSRR